MRTKEELTLLEEVKDRMECLKQSYFRMVTFASELEKQLGTNPHFIQHYEELLSMFEQIDRILEDETLSNDYLLAIRENLTTIQNDLEKRELITSLKANVSTVIASLFTNI